MGSPRIAVLAGAAFLAAGSALAVGLVLSDLEAAPAASRPAASIGGPFAMVDERGRRVSEADLTGRPTVLFFGFTWCPDVCPTTLFELTALMDALGSGADDVNFVMVSVDPERDRPEILREYLSAFDTRLRGFTGTKEEVARIANAYGVTIERVETAADYTMNHTASVFLMDAQNAFVGTITPHENPETALAKLRRLTAEL